MVMREMAGIVGRADGEGLDVVALAGEQAGLRWERTPASLSTRTDEGFACLGVFMGLPPFVSSSRNSVM